MHQPVHHQLFDNASTRQPLLVNVSPYDGRLKKESVGCRLWGETMTTMNHMFQPVKNQLFY